MRSTGARRGAIRVRRALDPVGLPADEPLPPSSRVRKVTLNEMMSEKQVACFEAEGAIVIANASCPEGTTAAAFGPTGQVTRIQANFDIPGLYVWHCHILEHEDDEMMRPYCVGGPETCPLPMNP